MCCRDAFLTEDRRRARRADNGIMSCFKISAGKPIMEAQSSRNDMRNMLATLLLSVALPASAPGLPGHLQPVPDPPPPPPGLELDPALEPPVTLIKRGSDTVGGYRGPGQL